MLQFQAPGFGQKVINTSLGFMVYYTQTAVPWIISETEDLPTLVFLHNFGGGASAYEWSKVYPAFATTHHILAPDLIGWGESAHPVRDYQVKDYLTVLAEFIRQTCPTPVTVVASSLTAALTIRLAITQPFYSKHCIWYARQDLMILDKVQDAGFPANYQYTSIRSFDLYFRCGK